MKERPILFSGPMVKAILDGRKTQTRRVIFITDPIGKKHPITSPKESFEDFGDGDFAYYSTGGMSGPYYCPHGSTGDRLWVRETWGVHVAWDDVKPIEIEAPLGLNSIWYAADGPKLAITGKTRSSIHMPRWASRITLEITNVRVERIQLISENDARSEGIFHNHCGWYIPGNARTGAPTAKECFRQLWDSINGKKYPLESNPWVWVIEFKRI